MTFDDIERDIERALSMDPVKYQTLNPKRFASNLNGLRKVSNNNILFPP